MTRPSEGQVGSEAVKQEIETISDTNNSLHHHHHQQHQPQHHQQDQSQDHQGDNNNNNKPKRNPFCSRCRNHGKSAQVKGHKRHCEYRDCQCEGCKLVEWRQIVSARQIKRRRYQKQDEECGRSIEISPPVLTREPNSDLAALIDQTLGSSKHVQQQPQSQQQHSSKIPKHLPLHLGPSSGNQPHHHHPHHHHQLHPHLPAAIHSAAAATFAAAAAVSLAPSSASASPAVSSQHHLHHHLHSGGGGGPGSSSSNHSTSSLNIGISSSSTSSANNNNNITNHNHHGHLNLNHHSLVAHNAAQMAPSNVGVRSPVSSALSNAFHLFQFPSSMLTAAAAASLAANPHVNNNSNNNSGNHPTGDGNSHFGGGSGSAGSLSLIPLTGNISSASTSPPLPSIREQITLVDDIHNSFGPLAIYAWLRSEQFDLQKIRDLIELSRVPFDELLQITGHSPLDLTSPIVD